MDVSETIHRNLSDIYDYHLVEPKIASGARLSCYIGYAPTKQIDFNYLIPCLKIRDLVSLQYNVCILLADVHARLDENKLSSHIINLRCEYYELVLTAMLQQLGVNMDHIKFVRGSDIQLGGDYIIDVWELSSRVSIEAASQTRSQSNNVGHLLYPIMQAIDENYVGQASFGVQVDMELGDESQKDIFLFSQKWDSKRITYLIHPSIPDLHLDLMDNDDIIWEKLRCRRTETLLALIKYILLPYNNNSLMCDNEVSYGTTLVYHDCDKMEADAEMGTIDLVEVCTKYCCEMIHPLRTYQHDITILLQQAW